MSKEDKLPDVAYEQQHGYVELAHAQAVMMLLAQRANADSNLEGALSYFGMLKYFLSDSELAEFYDILDTASISGFEPVSIFTRLRNLFENYPSLLAGFGRFLPPFLNLMLQTGHYPYVTLKSEDMSMESNETGRDSEETKSCDSNLDTSMPEVKIEDCDYNSSSMESFENKKDTSNHDKESSNANYYIPADFLDKVKDCFQNEPEVFRSFSQLLDSRQEFTGIILEHAMLDEVSEMFKDHADLFEEFKAFIQSSSGGSNEEVKISELDDVDLKDVKDEGNNPPEDELEVKKLTPITDPSRAPVHKYGIYDEHLLFDQIRDAVGYREVYDNFLRCLILFNNDVITRSQLVQMATNFLGRYPNLLKRFKDMLGLKENGDNVEFIPMRIEQLEKVRNDPETALDIDYATCGNAGASYRALPKDHEQPKCSGRTALCKEVLNDTWVSFPSWSEDSTFVTSCKTMFEEHMYRIEDERFELDMAISANNYTMQMLESVQKKINKMSNEEKNNFTLDDSLGSTSTVLHQKTLHRLYGDKTEELVDGLKRNPVVAVPIILKRLKVKEEEWKEKEQKYNLIWREQIDNYYLRSLDHQGLHFKQSDGRSFRPKTMLNDAEVILAEQKENGIITHKPQFILEFAEKSVVQDALNLMSQYVRRIPGVYRDDRLKIERVIQEFLPDFFQMSRTIPENVEAIDEEDSKANDIPIPPPHEPDVLDLPTSPSSNVPAADGSSDGEDSNNNKDSNDENDSSVASEHSFTDEVDVFDNLEPVPRTEMPYCLFYVSKNWYVFFRQFHLLCDRLTRLLHQSQKMEKAPSDEGSTGRTKDRVFTAEFQKHSYLEMLTNLRQLLSGTIDYSQFEEYARALFGIHAYISFTMDKLVLNTIRQLQQVVTDDLSKQCTSFFIQHQKSAFTIDCTTRMEAAQIEYEYRRKFERALDVEQRGFKIFWHKESSQMTIKLLDNDHQKSLPDPCEAEKWSNYLDEYLHGEIKDTNVVAEGSQPIFLNRNLRKQKAYWKSKISIVAKAWEKKNSPKSSKKSHILRKRKASALTSPIRSKLRRFSAAAAVEEQPQTADAVERLSEKEDEPKESEEKFQKLPVEEKDSETKDDEEVVDPETKDDKNIVEVNEEVEKTDLELDTKAQDAVEVTTVKDEENTDSVENTADETEEKMEVNDDDSNGPQEPLPETEKMEVDEDSNSLPAPTKENPVDEPEDSKPLEQAVVENEDQKKIEEKVENTEECLVSSIELAIEAADVASRIMNSLEDRFVDPETKITESITKKEIGEGDDPSMTLDESAETSDVPETPTKTDECKTPETPRSKASYRASYRSKKMRKDSAQAYAKRRVKRAVAMSKVYGSRSGKRKRHSTHTRSKIDDFEDIFFEYEWFSNLTEDEKACYLCMRNIVVQDDIEGFFKAGSYKIHFVQHCDTYIYRPDAAARAREVHRTISEIKTENFTNWHNVWLDRYVTSSMIFACQEWFQKENPEKFILESRPVTDCSKPPYFVYNKYKLRFYKIET